MRNWNPREKNGRSLPWAVRKWLKYENKLGDRLIKQLLNSVIAKYRDLSVASRSIICRSLSLRLRQIIDLLATDKSRYFAQPRPIIVNYLGEGSYYFNNAHGKLRPRQNKAPRMITIKNNVTIVLCSVMIKSKLYLIHLDIQGNFFLTWRKRGDVKGRCRGKTVNYHKTIVRG